MNFRSRSLWLDKSILLFVLLITTSAFSQAVSITRGPYLQMGSHDQMTIRWRTDTASTGRVWLGDRPDNLSFYVDDNNYTTEHEVTVTGLKASTRYYYMVATQSNNSWLSGGDAKTYFETSPHVGSTGYTRIWVIGDSGTANQNARNVYNAYQNKTGGKYTDLWLMLGDNAYSSGHDWEYQRAVFDIYGDLLRQTPVWPTLGNHDGYTADSASQSGPYYNIFSLPRWAQVGGVSSGTEAYYSFDYANIHFVVLDSYEGDLNVGGSMLRWLEADLQASHADWLIAFWHHPPYTKGSHDSDNEWGLIQVRENVLPILESYGVDLVLTGHSHSYERSKLIDGHYGKSWTYNDAYHAKDSGSGKANGSGVYRKPGNNAANQGAVYAVAGSSGKISGGPLNHPAMYTSINALGSMILEVQDKNLKAEFLDAYGRVLDHFSINKSGGQSKPTPPPSGNCTWYDNSSWPFCSIDVGGWGWENGSSCISSSICPGNSNQQQCRWHDGTTWPICPSDTGGWGWQQIGGNSHAESCISASVCP